MRGVNTKWVWVAGAVMVIALATWCGWRLLPRSPRAGEPAPASRRPPDVVRTPTGGLAIEPSHPSGSAPAPARGPAPTVRANPAPAREPAPMPIVSPGPAPTGVMASEGTYRDRVVVTWSALDDVSRYKVSRRPINSSRAPADLGLVGQGVAPRYDDVTAGDGEYEYQVSAARADGWSRPSAPAIGWRAKLDAPAVLFATDRTYADKIYVLWDPVRGAAAYELFRIQLQHTGPDASVRGVDETQDRLFEFADQAQEMVVYPCRELQFIDTAVTTNVYYAYRVRALDSAGGYSAFSPWDRGSTRPISDTLTAPAWVRASSHEPGFIRIEWEDNADRPGYELWRSEQPAVFWAKVRNPGVHGGGFVDRDVVPGVVYHYWLRSGDGGKSLSAFSPSAAGVAAPQPLSLE